MNESILATIKKLLGLERDYTAFDEDVIVHINSIIWKIRQLGCGIDDFQITGYNETWSDYLGEDYPRMPIVKTFIYMNVRLLFDPPTNASLYSQYTETIKEMESRIIYECDPRYE